eukprot:2716178-Ditylum_brightwellii.AAC.1
MLEELKKYKEIHGHCSVPDTCTSSKRLALGASTQRQQYRETKEGRSLIMAQERVDMLNNLGFVLKLQEENWYEMFNKLKKYKERHGDCRVPEIYAPNQQLGNW